MSLTAFTLIFGLGLIITHLPECATAGSRYFTVENYVLGDHRELIIGKVVKNKVSCAGLCNQRSDCLQYAINGSENSQCNLYSKLVSNRFESDDTYDSYIKLNPYGTVPKDYLLHLDPLVPYATDMILWQEAVEMKQRNFNLPAVHNLQTCYELCVAWSDNNCWVFSYAAVGGQCVIPDLFEEPLTYQVRAPLVAQSVPGAAVYMHNRAVVDNKYDDLLEDVSYFTVDGSYMYRGQNYADYDNNLIIPGIDSEEYCYRICLVTNSGNCTLISYSQELEVCVVAHGVGHTVLQEVDLHEDLQYKTLMFNGPYGDLLTDRTYMTLSESILYIGAEYNDAANNFIVSKVTSLQDCFLSCLMVNHGECLAFSYAEGSSTCSVPHSDGTLAMEDLQQKVISEYSSVIFVEGHTKDMNTQSYITLYDVISYYGTSSDDDLENRKMIGWSTKQDCYTNCLKTNNGHCYVFSYSSSTYTCIVPHDDGTKNIAAFGQELESGFETTIFSNHTSALLSDETYLTIVDTVYHRGSSISDANNLQLSGVSTLNDCYIICLDRNSGMCFSISYSSAHKTCILPQADGHTVLDDVSNTATSGYTTYYFTGYVAASNLLASDPHLILTDVIYYEIEMDNTQNYQSIGVTSEQDCYSLCLSRTSGDCFSFSYWAHAKRCLLTQNGASTSLEEMKRHISLSWNTYLFNDYTQRSLPSPNYLTLSNAILFQGSIDKQTKNFFTTGVASDLNCYAICLQANNDRCLFFSYSAADKDCRLPFDNGTMTLADLNNETSVGYSTMIASNYATSLLSQVDYLTLNDVKYAVGNNYELYEIGSQQDCYSTCLIANDGQCFSFSYTGTSKKCSFPLDDGSLHINDVVNMVEVGTITILLTGYVAASNPLASDAHLILTDMIYYEIEMDNSLNYHAYGVASQQDCYSLCLVRNAGDCFSFSYLAAEDQCLVTLDGANTFLEEMTKETSVGWSTYLFNAHASTALPSTNYMTLTGVVYFSGSSRSDETTNFISKGVESEQNCYCLCLERNSGYCLSLGYKSIDKKCRFPLVDQNTAIQDLENITQSDYSTLVFSAYASSDLISRNYVTLNDIQYTSPLQNFVMIGLASTQQCYTLCLLRNDGECFSFSYLPSESKCTIPVTDGTLKLADAVATSYDGDQTIIFTDYTSNNNPLTSEYVLTVSDLILYQGGTNWTDPLYNYLAEKVSSEQDCYTLCLTRNEGYCNYFSYQAVNKKCLVPIDSGILLINQLKQHSSSISTSKVIATSQSTQLSTYDHITLSGTIYHRGSSGDDLSKNFNLLGVTSTQDCYTACLLFNGGPCNTFSRGTSDNLCIIPHYTNGLLIDDYDQETAVNYESVHITTGYADTIPSTHITMSGVKWTKSLDANFELAGITSVQDCYTGCYMTNNKDCYSFSFSASLKICFFPTDPGSTDIFDMTESIDASFDTYLFLDSATNIDISTQSTFSLTNRILYRGNSYTASDNYQISGVTSSNDCFKLALMKNSGDKFSYSYSSSDSKCYVPSYQTGGYGIDGLSETTVSGATAVVFKDGYTSSLPAHTGVSHAIFHMGSSYTDSLTTYKMTGIASAQDCYTACLMRNSGQCAFFSHYSDVCYVPLTSSMDDLTSTHVSHYTTYLVTGYGMLASGSYATLGNTIAFAGSSYTNAASNFQIYADSYTDCSTICHLLNSGRCVSFSYGSSNCIVPYDSGSLAASSLSRQSTSGYTSYLVIQSSSGSTIHLGSYSHIPSQYMYLGSNMDDSNNNVKLSSVVSNAEDCYRLCYVSYSTNCKLFTYGSGVCSYPHQSTAIQHITNVNVGSSGSYNTYFLFSTSSRIESFISSTYSYLSNLRIRDGRSAHIYELTFNGIGDVTACYRLCLETMSSCQTFSYNPSTDYCYLTTVDFHAEWTYVDSMSGCTGYFAKNSGRWKVITKHRQYAGVMPDDAFNHGGSYHQVVPSGDLSASGSYTTYGNLKNQMIDHWDNLSSKYKIRMEFRTSSGGLLKYMEYNAASTSRNGWFTSGNFQSSSYLDLHGAVSHNYWTMGDTGRTFYLSHYHSGCGADAGWLQISATPNHGCNEWDRTSSVPMFLYSPNVGYVTWSNGRANFDVLMIYMSFN